MSFEPIDLTKIKTYPLKERKNKVKIEDFIDLDLFYGNFLDYFNSMPSILAANDLREVSNLIVNAYNNKKPVILAMGAHVIKCGLSPLIIELMKKKIITAIAFNGAGAIHDFEISYIGETSEDVAENIIEGVFGMAEESPQLINEAINNCLEKEIGIGQAIAEKIISLNCPYKEYSILYQGLQLQIPITIHVAIGTDIIHQHKNCNGAALGKGSFHDFKIFANQIIKLDEGGVYLNIGSAVILPEVFLKALTIARNLGNKVCSFTTVNFDRILHYRPKVNVIQRPTQEGGSGFSLIGHHEIMIPLLAKLILEKIKLLG
ncbi:MAG: hypothetical protein QMD92_08220 [bacterium]|nr:hypothetical protein [bacterium]